MFRHMKSTQRNIIIKQPRMMIEVDNESYHLFQLIKLSITINNLNYSIVVNNFKNHHLNYYQVIFKKITCDLTSFSGKEGYF